MRSTWLRGTSCVSRAMRLCNTRLPFGQLDARLAGLRFRAVHRGPRRDQLLAKPFEPLSKTPCGEAVILVVALDDQLVLLINALDISKLQSRPAPSPSSCRHPPAAQFL